MGDNTCRIVKQEELQKLLRLQMSRINKGDYNKIGGVDHFGIIGLQMNSLLKTVESIGQPRIKKSNIPLILVLPECYVPIVQQVKLMGCHYRNRKGVGGVCNKYVRELDPGILYDLGQPVAAQKFRKPYILLDVEFHSTEEYLKRCDNDQGKIIKLIKRQGRFPLVTQEVIAVETHMSNPIALYAVGSHYGFSKDFAFRDQGSFYQKNGVPYVSWLRLSYGGRFAPIFNCEPLSRLDIAS